MKNKEDEFKRLYGIKYTTFKEALDEIKKFENKRKKQSGRPQKLTYSKQLKMYLIHLKEDVSYFFLGKTYGISEANCWKIITKIENILLQSSKFQVKNIKKVSSDIEEVLIDATEVEIQNIKKEKNLYSGKKKELCKGSSSF